MGEILSAGLWHRDSAAGRRSLADALLEMVRTALYRDRDYHLTPDEDTRFHELVRRRGAHEPIAYLTGEREFWSRPLVVRPGVLIPRPDPEWVVEAALRYRRSCYACTRAAMSSIWAREAGTSPLPWQTSLALVYVTAIDSSRSPGRGPAQRPVLPCGRANTFCLW